MCAQSVDMVDTWTTSLIGSREARASKSYSVLLGADALNASYISDV